MKSRLDRACNRILQEAMNIWALEGAVMPTMWAVGKHHAIFAQPFDDEGLRIPMVERVAIHSAIAHAIDATIVGQIDEAYTQIRDHDDPPCEGELADCADTDPTIKTSICVEGLDMVREVNHLHAARLDLSDTGEPQWRVAVFDEAETEATEILLNVATYTKELRDKMSFDVLNPYLFEFRWTCILMTTRELNL